MKRKISGGIVAIALAVPLLILLQAALVAAQPCSCGPDYCQNDPRYPKLLADKKKEMSKTYPADLIALLDRDGKCVAAITQAPDIFSIKVVGRNNSTTLHWTKEEEERTRNNLKNGSLSAYYKFNTNRAFACCGEPSYNERPDWNDKLDMNMSLALECKKSGADIVCK